MKSRSLLPSIILCLSLIFLPFSALAVTIEISAIVPGCGDGIVGVGEQCDISDLGGASCSERGFSGGSLSCTSACTFNTSSCTSATVSWGGGGGGGGGNSGVGITSIPDTNVVFTGKAYPKSTVTLLKDAQVVATTIADANANFQVTISGVSSGNYIFSVYSEDNKGIRSSLFTFPVGITSGVTTKVGDIFIAPSIAVDKSEVRRGDNIVIFGQSTPSSEITISINSEEEFFVKKMSDANGAYLLSFDTSVLEIGQHNTKSKGALNGEISAFSKVVGFTVGTKNVITQLPEKTAPAADINGDNKVNLVDFSIAAYWYKRPNPPASSDVNKDGKVNLIDFSIMAFNWTG
ncbi:MAG: dockerin type I repeat-containing protein [Patescibacteria group bacterium]